MIAVVPGMEHKFAQKVSVVLKSVHGGHAAAVQTVALPDRYRLLCHAEDRWNGVNDSQNFYLITLIDSQRIHPESAIAHHAWQVILDKVCLLF